MVKKAKPRAAPKADLPARILARALALAATRGWGALALADIAAAAKVSMAELYAHYPSKPALVAAFLRDTDRRVLAGLAAEPPEGSARDRLFDVLMRRFDALAPHRAAVESILAATARDPVALGCGLGPFRRSMACMLEAAGIDASGLGGAVRTKGLAAVYLSMIPVWLGDDSPDKARTMAALDTRLRRVEACLGLLRRSKRAAAPA